MKTEKLIVIHIVYWFGIMILLNYECFHSENFKLIKYREGYISILPLVIIVSMPIMVALSWKKQIDSSKRLQTNYFKLFPIIAFALTLLSFAMVSVEMIGYYSSSKIFK